MFNVRFFTSFRFFGSTNTIHSLSVPTSLHIFVSNFQILGCLIQTRWENPSLFQPSQVLLVLCGFVSGVVKLTLHDSGTNNGGLLQIVFFIFLIFLKVHPT